MKIIDIEKWARTAHYNCFKSYTNPIFGITARLDVTEVVRYSKRTNTSFFANFLYLVMRALTSVEEFRIRIKDDKVVIYDNISPSFIVMNDENVIVTCRVENAEDYKTFYERVRTAIERVKHEPKREKFNTSDANDVFYISCLPCIDFVSMTNPYDFSNDEATSIPRIAWGKFVDEGGRNKMTFTVEAHHALIDGSPVACGINELQRLMNNADDVFGEKYEG